MKNLSFLLVILLVCFPVFAEVERSSGWVQKGGNIVRDYGGNEHGRFNTDGDFSVSRGLLIVNEDGSNFTIKGGSVVLAVANVGSAGSDTQLELQGGAGGSSTIVLADTTGSEGSIVYSHTIDTLAFYGRGTNALLASYDSAGTFEIAGGFWSSSATSLGWAVVAQANQACTTTCTYAAVVGWDAGASQIVDAVDATADRCLCAGAR